MSKFSFKSISLQTANLYALFLTVLCFAGFSQNILISNKFNPNEPSIMLDPKNPATIVAGANLNNYYLSSDTGRTWTEHSLSSSYGVWGDPAITVDTNGAFYFMHLSNPVGGSWIDRIVCQKSTNAGGTWSNGSFTGLNGLKAQDKQWCTVDRQTNIIYTTWTQFDNYGTTSVNDSTLILFSKSNDGGATWSQAKVISKDAGDCFDEDNTVEGAVPAVGPNGEVYVAWAGPNGLVFNKSLDQGTTWLAQETAITSMPGGWDFNIPSISRANGLPITACDVSNGPNRGDIYVNWSDQRNGTTNTDVWLTKSSDGGQTWSAIKKVNDDTGNKQQFFTWMTIDQTNGYLYFIFYDRRNYTNDSTDVYMAVSTDGGSSFVNKKISQSPFKPTANIFFGDYTNVVAHNGVIRPIWTRLNSGQLSIWTDLTKHEDFYNLTGLGEEKGNEALSFENFPNPAEDIEYVSFKLHSQAIVNLSLYNAEGKQVHVLINNETRGYGKYIERVALNQLELKTGSYYLKLRINGVEKVNRLLLR